MPKFLIRKNEKEVNTFEIRPNIKLNREYQDWPQRIKVSIERLKEGTDFGYIIKPRSNPYLSNITRGQHHRAIDPGQERFQVEAIGDRYSQRH